MENLADNTAPTSPVTAPPASNGAAAEGKRKRISKREYFDADGKEASGPVPGGSVRYSLLQDDATVLKSFDYTSQDMFALFGFVTKVGNVANTVLNDKDAPGSREDAVDEITTWLEDAENGQWREPGQARAPKWNKDILAAAIHESLAERAKGDVAHYRARLEDRSYFGKVTNPINPAIKTIYDRLFTEAGGTIAEPRKPQAVEDLA